MSANDPRHGRLTNAAFLDDPAVRRVFAALDGSGQETRVVGGAVRNVLLQAPVYEVDFATTATPDEIIRAARTAKLRAIPTGIEHGTITLIVDGTPFEVTTLREDVETDGRRARVRFGRGFEHDALRRDFTINALSVDAEGALYDYAGGLADIAARRVRFIGEARQRIREDFLRILRFFRFHAAYGEGAMDAEAFHAVIAEREGLRALSRERIRAELFKLLNARRAADVVADMSGAGLLQILLAGVALPARLARAAAIETARGEPPDAALRFIALCVMRGEDAARLRDLLRLSNNEFIRAERAAQALEKLHARKTAPQPRELRMFLFEQGRLAACDSITLAHAQSGAAADDPAWNSAWRFLRDTPEPRLPYSGADLLARGLRPGTQIGRILKILQANWIRAGFPHDPAVLARLLDEAMERARD